MAMTVQRRKDAKVPRVFVHKIADIRGGVSVAVSELGSDFLLEGAVLSAPENGICHVVKTAEVVAAVTATGKSVQVKKGHQFNVGDVVLIAEGAKATAITEIDKTANTYDTIKLTAALGAIAIGGFLTEAAAATDGTDSTLKYTPLAVNGTGKPISQGQNLDTDAWVIGVTKGNPLPECVVNHLKGIINY